MKIKVTGQCPQRARRLHGHSEVTTKSEERNGEPRQACVKSSTSTFEVSGGRPVLVHARVMEHDRADRLADDAAITSGLRLRGFEMLRELETQSQGHHAIDRLEERGRERGMSRRSSRKGRERLSSVRRTLELFRWQFWADYRKTVWTAYGLSLARRYRLELYFCCLVLCLHLWDRMTIGNQDKVILNLPVLAMADDRMTRRTQNEVKIIFSLFGMSNGRRSDDIWNTKCGQGHFSLFGICNGRRPDDTENIK